jgi:hypothetical protein
MEVALMSASFIAVVFLAAILLVNWRLVLLLIGACIVALIAFGIGVVAPELSPDSTPNSTTGGTVHLDPAGPPAGDVGQPPPH